MACTGWRRLGAWGGVKGEGVRGGEGGGGAHSRMGPGTRQGF